MSHGQAFTDETIGTWLTKAEAARTLECSAATVRLLAERGRLRVVRTRLGMLVDPVDLERLRLAREVARAGSSEPRG
jgi:excisionase family DNA binding protein